MSEYNKAQLNALGVRLVELVDAVADGLDVTDVAVGINVLRAFMEAADDFALDKDAALLDVLAGAAGAAADRRLSLPPEAPNVQ